MSDENQSSGVGIQTLEREATSRQTSQPGKTHNKEVSPRSPVTPSASEITPSPVDQVVVTRKKRKLTSPSFMVAYFAILNVVMYLTIHKFWIGGSSFLPMLGKLGPENKFLLAMLVNVGVIIGSFIGAYGSGEFRLRLPRRRELLKAVIGGSLIGMGVTIAPGTCTTAFVTGIPMLSVSSFLSVAGILIGSHLVYRFTLGRR